jgi:hypothetical protein
MQQDALADEYHSWRGIWVSTMFTPEATKAAATEKYINETLPKHLKTFEAMYSKFAVDGSVYAGGVSAPLLGGTGVSLFSFLLQLKKLNIALLQCSAHVSDSGQFVLCLCCNGALL